MKNEITVENIYSYLLDRQMHFRQSMESYFDVLTDKDKELLEKMSRKLFLLSKINNKYELSLSSKVLFIYSDLCVDLLLKDKEFIDFVFYIAEKQNFNPKMITSTIQKFLSQTKYKNYFNDKAAENA